MTPVCSVHFKFRQTHRRAASKLCARFLVAAVWTIFFCIEWHSLTIRHPYHPYQSSRHWSDSKLVQWFELYQKAKHPFKSASYLFNHFQWDLSFCASVLHLQWLPHRFSEFLHIWELKVTYTLTKPPSLKLLSGSILMGSVGKPFFSNNETIQVCDPGQVLYGGVKKCQRSSLFLLRPAAENVVTQQELMQTLCTCPRNTLNKDENITHMFKVGRDVIIFRGHSQKEGPLSTDLSHIWPFSRAIMWKKTKQKTPPWTRCKNLPMHMSPRVHRRCSLLICSKCLPAARDGTG